MSYPQKSTETKQEFSFSALFDSPQENRLPTKALADTGMERLEIEIMVYQFAIVDRHILM